MSTPPFAPPSLAEALYSKPCRLGQAELVGCGVPHSVAAGFPSPAEDLGGQRIDLGQLLVTHPQATYFVRANGHSMVDAGILDKDIMVVDRAIKPRHGHVVIAMVDGDFTVKQLYQRAGRTKLKAANPLYPDITPQDGQTLEIWGVVTATVRQLVV